MSLDNVLAVAGAAREHPGILIVGLIFAVASDGPRRQYRRQIYRALPLDRLCRPARHPLRRRQDDLGRLARGRARCSASPPRGMDDRTAAATIYALASGRPPAAIAIIRVSGAAAHEAGRLIAGPLPRAREVALRELRHPQSGMLLDHGLVLRFDGPASSTGEDVVEFHIHGGRAVADAMLDALASLAGLRLAEAWGIHPPGAREWPDRPDRGGRPGRFDRGGDRDPAARGAGLGRRGPEATDRAMAGPICSFSRRRPRRRSIMHEDDEHSPVDTLCSDCGALATELRSWLDRPRMEPLRDGVKVVVAGPPNSGKSSLVNAIAGAERAIVTDIAGHHPRSYRGALVACRDPAAADGHGRFA